MFLITGATGHIGNVLVRQLLQKGHKVRALVLPGESTKPLEGLDVEMVEGDVLDLSSLWNALKGIRGIFHLAGIISIMPGSEPQVWRVNVDGTRNVIQAALDAKVERLVYTSSIHAIQRAPHGMVINESLPFDPNNHYGEYDRSKAQASLEVMQASQKGLNAVIVCPTGVIGPYDFRGSEMGEVIHQAAAGQTSPYIDGAYDFVDVRDVAKGMIQAAEKGRSGEAYILSGQRMSVRYLLETVHEVTGRAFTKIRIPAWLARFAAIFTPWYYRKTGSKPRFTPYSLEVLRSNANISHAKATRELGYKPRKLYESIADTVKWFFEYRRSLPAKG